MKILRVISTMDPRFGGPVEGVRQINGVLALDGHELEIACLDDPASPWLNQLPWPTHGLGPGAALGSYNYSKGLVPWLRANASRFDCVVVHGLWQYSSFGTWRALRSSDTPYFLYPHGMLDPWFNRAYPLKRVKKAVYWRMAEHRVVRDARAVLFTSQEEQRLAAESFRPYRCKGVTVNYGTSGPSGDPAAQRTAFLDRFPELQGKRFLLYLSRIHPKKGCDLLIRAFARAAADTDVRLVMAGPDEQGWRARLQGEAEALGVSDRITWAGMLAGDMKWGAFHAAEAFVLPSHQENFGISVAEALACGLPVLISDKVNIYREILADRAGFVAADDLAGTTETVRDWLACTPPELEAMRARAVDCFQTRFHIRSAADSLVGVLRAHGVGERKAAIVGP